MCKAIDDMRNASRAEGEKTGENKLAALMDGPDESRMEILWLLRMII